ncbi:MAG: O-antigen ligase family protein [Clostridia bacterium]|nr:O-antigen ligase family protein [Clostridia bacterium]
MIVLQEKLCRAVESRWMMLAFTLFACAATAFSFEHYAIPVFILAMLVILIVSPNFLDILLPILLLNALAFRTTGQSEMLAKHVWLAFPVAAAIVLHFVLHRRPFVIGKSFYPLLAVSVALLLGGVGSVTVTEYFHFGSLYYTFFLGVGMIFFYLWMRSRIFSTDAYDAKDRFMSVLLLMGIYSSFIIWEHAFRTLLAFGEMKVPVAPNDLCELILFAIPAAFYFAVKNYKYLVLGFVLYFSMVPARSLSALFFGALLIAFCLWYVFCYRPGHRALTVLITVACVCSALLIAWKADILSSAGFERFFLDEENGRLSLFRKYAERFLEYPVFGGGMGMEIDDATFMGYPWAHNYILQILGSLGIVGALAYGYQFVVRIRLMFSRIDFFRGALSLCYLGIFSISMLQPGEFCPMPYELLAVCLFVFLEMTENGDVPTHSLDRRYFAS